ncbi:MAG: PAS-domain containing protein [Alphaproteobacteria bacterium]|nr:PAS-domain containing protein [Alphaproteobacteria bacterium]
MIVVRGPAIAIALKSDQTLAIAARRRLRTVSVLMLAATLFTAVIALAAGYRSWDNALSREESFLRGTTGSLVATIDRRLELVEGVLSTVAAYEASIETRSYDGGGFLDPEFGRLRSLSLGVESLGIADVSGRLVAIWPPSTVSADADAMAAQALSHHSRPGADAMLIAPGPSRGADRRIIFVISRALRGADGGLSGVVFAALPIDDLVATVAESINREGGRVTVLNGAYHVIARLPRASLGADLSKTPISLAIKAAPGTGVLRARSTIDGLELLTFYASSPRFPLHVVMSKDLPAIRSNWLDEQWLEFLLLGLLFAGTLLSNVALNRTMRRQQVAENALRTSDQRRYQHGLEGARDGLAIWDRDGELVVWNSRFDELAGLLGAKLRAGMSYRDLLRGAARAATVGNGIDSPADWFDRLSLAHDRADVEPSEIVLPEACILDVAHQRAANGDTVTTLRDVSAERAAQRRIESSEARFRDGIESMGEGFALWDHDDRLVAWNERILQLMPLQVPMMRLGTRFEDVLAHLARHAADQPQPEEWLAHLAERRRRRERLGIPATFRTGAGHLVEAVDRPTSDGGIVTIVRDVTDQHRLLDRLQAGEAELRRALAAERDMNEQQRRFVAMASHEFRTPLAIIDSATQRLIAANVVPAATPSHKRLDRIRESVSRMTEIIDRTLATARLDEGRIEFLPEAFDLVALAREVIRRQLTIAPDYRIDLDLTAPELVVDADRRLIDHVLTNLLSNAVKYSPRIRRAELRIDLDGDDVVIAVSDQGVGIPAGEIDRLFTRFFRASTATGIVGTGIGLHLVREFVAMHGGRIEVRSEIGRGSVFTVRLPRRRRVDAAA